MNKPDYNYIAAVEKAITKKYGKNTVQDFRSDWQQEKEKDYLDQLKAKRIKRQKMSPNFLTILIKSFQHF